MRLILAVAALAFLADPALAQQDDQVPAPADSAAGQLDNATSADQSTGQTFDGGNGPADAFPDSTAIPQPAISDSSAADSMSADAASADSAPADGSDEPQ